MGPRKAVVSRKRFLSSSVSERRSKQRTDPAQSAPPPVPPQISMTNRTVTSGRKVLFDFLDQESFSFGQLFKNQGWEKFCNLEIETYPSLVKCFFENLRIGSGHIFSIVKGKEIVLDETRLSRILDMPTQGICFLTLSKKIEGLQVVLERRDVKNLGNVQAKQLSVEMRLLHNMVSRIFFPKTGRFDWVTEKDIAFIYYLVKNHPINLPFLMINQIKEAARKSRACLPYGMVFTLLFQEFGVDLLGETARKLLNTDFYNDKSLHRMGIFKVDNRWTRKSSGQKITRSDSSDNSDEEADPSDDSDAVAAEDEPQDNTTSVPEQSAGPSSQSIPEASSPRTPPAAPAPTEPSAPVSTGITFEQLSQFSDSLFSKFDTKFDELRGDLRQLSTRVESLEHRFSSQESIPADIQSLRSDIDRSTLAHSELTSSVMQGIHRLESELGAVLLRVTGSRSAFGASSSQSSRPAPSPAPRPPPAPRAPFTTTVRPGTGFPPPPRVGPASRTRNSSGPSPIRSPRVMAPFTIELPDEEEDSD